MVEHPESEVAGRFVLCRIQSRAEKEWAMLRRQSERLSEELIKVDTWLRRSPQSDHESLGRRIGRHLGKNPAAAAIIDAEVLRDGQGRACALRISSRLDAGQKVHREKGTYLLRTNCKETDPVLLWKWYIQLTQAEAAFCTVKSDMGLRPIYHHKDNRDQAQILVCFLVLALWRTLEQLIQQKGLGSCARQLVEEIAGIKSVDVVIPVRRAGVDTEQRLRVVPLPRPQPLNYSPTWAYA